MSKIIHSISGGKTSTYLAAHYPDIKQWAIGEEQRMGNTFKTEASLTEIMQLEPDPDFVLGGGSGCQSGMCTD